MTDWNETGSVFAPANQEKFDPPAPTPLDRLEAWRKGGEKLDYIIFTDFSADHTYTVELWGPKVEIAYGTGDTLDAAILAALAQAEGER